MKQRTNRYGILFLCSVAAIMLATSIVPGALFAQSSAQTAENIISLSRERIKAATTSTRMRMVVAAKDGSLTERLVDQYTSKADSSSKTVVVFQKPSSIAGTRFLTITETGKQANQWIFLPSLGKVRRIAAGEGSASFMGTDMSNDDLSAQDRAVNLDTHTIVKEENIGGKDYWVIESTPKDSGYQYSRMLAWIEKDSYVNLKNECYDKKGGLIKIIQMSEFKDVQGRLTAMVMKISTVQAKTSTTIYSDIVKYDDPIPASVFTEKFLLTGRP